MGREQCVLLIHMALKGVLESEIVKIDRCEFGCDRIEEL